MKNCDKDQEIVGYDCTEMGGYQVQIVNLNDEFVEYIYAKDKKKLYRAKIHVTDNGYYFIDNMKHRHNSDTILRYPY